MRHLRWLASAFFMFATLLWGQGQKPTKVITTESVPTFEVSFKEDRSISGLPATSVFSGTHCAGDGTAFIEMEQPPDFLESHYYSISPKGSHEFSRQQISDLSVVAISNFYPSDSMVLFLVIARRGDGTRHSYLARFDRDGTYKGSVQVDDSITPSQVGMFDSGTFLAAGIDRVSKDSRLALLDTDGSLLRILDVPKSMTEWTNAIHESVAPNNPSAGVLAAIQLVPFRNSILVVPETASTGTSRVPILEVRDGGAIRVVRLKVPNNYSIDGFVPSQDHWYVRFKTTPAGNADGGKDASSDVVLFEVSPSDGTLLRQLKPLPPVYSLDITCTDGDQFVAFQRDSDSRLKGMRGEVVAAHTSGPSPTRR